MACDTCRNRPVQILSSFYSIEVSPDGVNWKQIDGVYTLDHNLAQDKLENLLGKGWDSAGYRRVDVLSTGEVRAAPDFTFVW